MPISFSPKIIGGLVLTFLVSAGISYALPSGSLDLISPVGQESTEQKVNAGKGFGQFANEPQTEKCPLNGKLFSKSEKTLWEKRRPILAMVENHLDARPQSGLSSADIVYEAVAEGGITRFMGVFYCGAQADNAIIAPVRSARIYFINIAAEYNTPVYMHVGGGNCSNADGSSVCTTNKKALALEELGKLGWRKAGGNDFDTTFDSGMPVFTRDYNRLGEGKTIANEHTMVGSLPSAFRQAEKRGFASTMKDGSTWLSGFKAWKIDEKDAPKGTAATDIKYDFWPKYADFSVEWKYDPATKTYLRNQGGAAHVDLETQKQIAASNVIVQLTKEEGPLDEHMHMFYYVIGEGTGYLFRDGLATEIKWKKATQTGRTIFTDKAGKEISFTPGTIWISIVPSKNAITFQ